MIYIYIYIYILPLSLCKPHAIAPQSYISHTQTHPHQTNNILNTHIQLNLNWSAFYVLYTLHVFFSLNY